MEDHETGAEWRYIGGGEKDLHECSAGCGARCLPGAFEDRHAEGCEFATSCTCGGERAGLDCLPTCALQREGGAS